MRRGWGEVQGQGRRLQGAGWGDEGTGPCRAWRQDRQQGGATAWCRGAAAMTIVGQLKQ